MMNQWQLVCKSILVYTLIVLSSCIGEVETGKVSSSKTKDNIEETNIDYTGVSLVKAIAHNKIDIFFPQKPGDQENYNYLIYVNSTKIPIELKGASLELSLNGQFKYTVTQYGGGYTLDLNTIYTFRVEVYDIGQEKESESGVTLTAATFDNKTAEFAGISDVQVARGIAGLDTVIVSWIPAVQYGTTINPQAQDVNSYEISYISSTGGFRNINNEAYTGLDRVKLSISPSLREAQISGLSPGQTYYFQVRAVHNGYVDNIDLDPGYNKDENTKILTVTLPNTGEDANFNSASLEVQNINGDQGLSKVDLLWEEASGNFYYYRVFKALVSSSSDPDALTNDVIDTLTSSSDYVQVSAEDNNYRLTSLTAYSYYQVKVAVCMDATCDRTNRILSDLRSIRVLSRVIDFSGIIDIDNPRSASETTTLHLKFDPPVLTTGYLTDLEVYCYQGVNDPLPVLMNTSGDISGSGKTNCENFRRLTAAPASFSGYSSLEEISIRLNSGSLDEKSQYCFSVIPVIDESGYIYRDLDSAIVRCIYPEIVTPRLAEFPGKVDVCSTYEDTLTVEWNTPTGGIFENFIVFWKEKNAVPFDVSAAIAEYEASTNNNYFYTDGLASSATNFTITNLEPGKRYHSHVLTYINDGGTYRYSELNSVSTDCLIPLPQPIFKEWVEVIALGPKIDGLVHPENNSFRKARLETFDADSTPLEAETDASDTPLDASKLGTAIFNGVYGAAEADSGSNPLHQYSNSGMIKIAWEEVDIFSGNDSFNYLIANYENGTPIKSARTIGYKVYRSEDNKNSWVELTDSSYAFQTNSNSGLLTSSSYNFYKRSNAATTNINRVEFIDYSVKTTGQVGFTANSHDIQTERARVYWYKIVPFFKGQPLTYENEDTNSHHIIRVLLPPPNMALVHRMMANRTICYEMGKDINKGSNDFYSCPYAGLGATYQGVPWPVGQGVYDLGGDLLVDRFELGCNFTRGDIGSVQSNYTGSFDGFEGESDTSTPFRGCIDGQNGAYSMSTSINSNGANDADIDYSEVIGGDCLFSGSLNGVTTNPCASYPSTSDRSYRVPGMDGSLDCTVDETTGAIGSAQYLDFFDDNIAKSEMGAIAFNRKSTSASSPIYYRANGSGAGEKYINATGASSLSQGNCYMNLAYQDNIGRMRSRWFTLADLFEGLVFDNGGVSQSTIGNLASTRVDDLDDESRLYDGVNTIYPTSLVDANRLPANLPMARAFASNNSKLPPIGNLAQEDAQILCNQFQVEIGYETSDTFYSLRAATDKRIMRRKEFIAAGAWSDQYDSTKITDIEDGSFTESGNEVGCNSNLRSNGESGVFIGTNSSISTRSSLDNTSSGTVYLTGSSAVDPTSSDYNTEKCVSKFGIQDLVGNFTEYSAEKFFCDTSSETLAIGPSENMAVSQQMSSSAYYNFISLTAWVLSDPDTGQCSLVEQGATRLGADYLSGGALSPIELYGGGYAAFVEAFNTLDQHSISDMRSADGFFMDFGQDNFGPPLSDFDTMSISTVGIRSTDNRLGEYFSPVLGMTLQCGNNGCDTVANSSSDIKLFTVEEFTADPLTPGSEVDPTQIIIPTGNSQIFSDGMSEITFSDTTSFPNATGTDVNNFIDAVDAGADPVDLTDGSFTYDSLLSTDVSAKQVRRVHWVTNRAGELQMTQGGSILARGAGRYNMHLRGQEEQSQRVSRDRGTRCMVKIKYDY
jgi:hypothetical protein